MTHPAGAKPAIGRLQDTKRAVHSLQKQPHLQPFRQVSASRFTLSAAESPGSLQKQALAYAAVFGPFIKTGISAKANASASCKGSGPGGLGRRAQNACESNAVGMGGVAALAGTRVRVRSGKNAETMYTRATLENLYIGVRGPTAASGKTDGVPSVNPTSGL